MRLRRQRKIRKLLRRAGIASHFLADAVTAKERAGVPLNEALRAIMLDPAGSHFDRGQAARLLADAGEDPLPPLLALFFSQSGQVTLYTTALTLEMLDDRRAVGPLIEALLEDGNPDRRHAAARALGWISRPGRRAARALARCLADVTQPEPAREEAAESLAYAGTRETIPALISALGDREVRVRFWAVFALGSSCRGDAEAIRALEAMLPDEEMPPGNWWSVGKEALGMLGLRQPSASQYESRVAAEAARIKEDPAASEADRRWAECYG